MTITRLELPSVEQLRDSYCQDVSRLVAGKNVAKGSETYARGTAVASAAQMIMARQVALQDAQMPDTATGEDLDRLLKVHGVTVSAGSGATGYVLAECSGSVTYPKGLQGKTADGLRYQVTNTTFATNGAQIPVEGIDTGKRTDKPAGAVITWQSPPSGSAATAVVDVDGLRFGSDADNQTSKQRKLRDKLRNPPRGSNWAQIALDAQAGSPSIEKAFVYPAVYGPSTMHVAITVAADADSAYSRQANGTLQFMAASSVVSKHAEHADLTLTSVRDLECDLLLRVLIPEPLAAGGVGGGWLDTSAIRWPTGISGITFRGAYLHSTPTSPTQLHVACTDMPVVGARFCVWSTSTKKMLHCKVKSVTGTVSPVLVELEESIDVSVLQSGDWLMPDCENADSYAAHIASAFASLGPGEKTTSADTAKRPRSLRKPREQTEWPKDVTSLQVSLPFAEVRHVELLSAWVGSTRHTSMPIECPDETTTGAAPYVFRLGRLALYED